MWNIKQIILREDSKQTKPVLEVVDKGLPAVLTPEDKHKFQVPVDLVNYYHPTFVKLDCWSNEHYVLEQLVQLPELGVKKLAVEFHKTEVFQPSKGMDFLRQSLGNGFKVWDM